MPLRHVWPTGDPTDDGSGGTGGTGGTGGSGTGGIIVPSGTGTTAVDASSGSMVATWKAPDGSLWQLTDSSDRYGWFTREDIGGWGATTYEITSDPNARGGDTVRHVRSQPARITWPLYIWGDNHQQFVERERTIKRAITMTVHRGQPGVLRVQRPDGSAREIDAFYEEGFGGSGEMWLHANTVLTFYCPDGYWRDVAPTVARRSYAPPATFFRPFLTITGSNVLGDTVVDNPGDVTAWPTWTITGPATQLIATNVTTGQSFTLTYNLLAGQKITITTDRPTVRGPAGENIVSALNWPQAYLWGLVPGDNTVAFTAAGSGDGSAAAMAFHARYEGA